MQHYYNFITVGTLIGMLSCGAPPSTQEPSATLQETTASVSPSQKNITENSPAQTSATGEELEAKTLENTDVLSLQDPIQQILQDPKAEIAYAPQDNTVIRQDTTLMMNGEKVVLSYITTCLNDHSVLQEFFVWDKKKPKNSYLITHNYQTELILKKANGQLLATKIIKKDYFRDELNPDFLQKSILKHPDFIGYNPENQEVMFSFLVGIPSTDLLVIATIKLNSIGQLQIIKVENASL